MPIFLFLIFISLSLISFIIFIIKTYAEGAARYALMNCKDTLNEEIESIDHAIQKEINELIDEIPYTFAWYCEKQDVIYLRTKLELVKRIKFYQYSDPEIWYPLFWKAPLTTSKMAWRYYKYSCVRSQKHHGEHQKHIC